MHGVIRNRSLVNHLAADQCIVILFHYLTLLLGPNTEKKTITPTDRSLRHYLWWIHRLRNFDVTQTHVVTFRGTKFGRVRFPAVAKLIIHKRSLQKTLWYNTRKDTSSALVCRGSFSKLMTQCSSQTPRRSVSPRSSHGKLAWKVKQTLPLNS